MIRGPSRRDVLRALAIGGPAVAAGCSDDRVYDPARVEPDADWAGLGAPDADLFRDGIQAGDVRPDSVVLWTRYGGAAALQVIAKAWDGTAWVDVAEVDAPVADRGFVHVTVDGFDADAPIAYQFRDGDGALSPVGHARTAPADNASRTIRFGATSCCSPHRTPFAAIESAANRSPMDFFIWNGDTVYADHATDQDTYEALWDANLQTSGFQAVTARTIGVITWDDHEVTNDFGIDATIPAERVALAKDVFFEYAPIRELPEEPQRIWRTHRFGAVEVFVLDSRGEHDFEAGEYLSAEQFQWLLDGLAASTAVWKVIVNSVPIALLPPAYNILDLSHEHWNGYPEQRSALVAHIVDNAITGVIFVSGDIHHPALARVDADGPGSSLLDFIVGPAGSDLNALGRVIMDGAQYIWSDAAWNAARFELRPEGLGHCAWVTEEDETLAEAWFDVHGEVLFLDWTPY